MPGPSERRSRQRPPRSPRPPAPRAPPRTGEPRSRPARPGRPRRRPWLPSWRACGRSSWPPACGPACSRRAPRQRGPRQRGPRAAPVASARASVADGSGTEPPAAALVSTVAGSAGAGACAFLVARRGARLRAGAAVGSGCCAAGAGAAAPGASEAAAPASRSPEGAASAALNRLSVEAIWRPSVIHGRGPHPRGRGLSDQHRGARVVRRVRQRVPVARKSMGYTGPARAGSAAPVRRRRRSCRQPMDRPPQRLRPAEGPAPAGSPGVVSAARAP